MKIKTVLTIVSIVSVVVSILTSIYGTAQKTKADRFENNLYSKTVEYQDDLGRKVTEVTELQISLKELKKVAKKDSSELSSAYEKKLYEVTKELNHSDRKLKHVEKVMKLSTSTFETVNTQLKDTFINEMPIKAAYVSNDFGKYRYEYNPMNDSLKMELLQRNEFYLDIYKERELNKKGKQVFYLWRFIKDWRYKGSVKTLNDSTEITEFTLLNIQKR